MKKLATLLTVAILGGAVALVGLQFFKTEDSEGLKHRLTQLEQQSKTTALQQVSTTRNTNYTAAAATGIDFTSAAAATLDAVVHVKNKQIARRPLSIFDYFNGRSQQPSGQPLLAGAGSGVIISADGHIVTNNHVIKDATEIEVTLNDNRTYIAEVVGTDTKADIALIKIPMDEALPFIPFGDSDTARVGEWVLAVGNPFDLTSTVTAGIISAKGRDINEYDRNYQSFIQTDAAINPGNSGGALVNIHGELVGINTAITSQTGSYVGYAFAVPSNNVRKIVQDLMEFGDVQEGMLGVVGTSVTDRIAKKYSLSTTEGFYISDIQPDSGAEKAGLRQGDIIRKIDNVAINKFADLSGFISSKRPDDVVKVLFERDGDIKTVPVTIYKPNTYLIDRLGIKVRPANKEDLARFNEDGGVVISELDPSKYQYGDLVGLVITEIDDKQVRSVEEVREIIEKKKADEPLSIVFLNRRGERNRYIFDD